MFYHPPLRKMPNFETCLSNEPSPPTKPHQKLIFANKSRGLIREITVGNPFFGDQFLSWFGRSIAIIAAQFCLRNSQFFQSCIFCVELDVKKTPATELRPNCFVLHAKDRFINFELKLWPTSGREK